MNRWRERSGRRGGFSLTEVVVAVGIFSLAIVSLMGLLSIALSTQQQSVMQTQAANIAAEIISRRRAAPQVDAKDFKGESGGARTLIVPALNKITSQTPNFSGDADATEVVDTTGFVVEGAKSGPSAGVSEGVQFLCEFRGWRDALSGASSDNSLYYVHLRLLWPVEVARSNPKRADSYEVLTMMTEK